MKNKIIKECLKLKHYILIMTFGGFAMTLNGYDRITGEAFASRSEVIGQNGMVATSHPERWWNPKPRKWFWKSDRG